MRCPSRTRFLSTLLLLTMTGAPLLADSYTPTDFNSSSTVDINEQTHLVFMREEEKLARDVYITLGNRYPEFQVFALIEDSEQQHTDRVKSVLEYYSIEDPSTSDVVGEFTGEDYGWYFTGKYDELVAWGYTSDLEALKVGAFIEELDMLDIAQCPKVIVETDNGIDDFLSCGKVYTDNPDIIRVYDHLIAGSKNHLRAYVKNIENFIGEGNYEAQVLTQEQVDEILGRD